MSSETSRRRWLWLVALVVFAAGAYWLRAMLGGRPTSAAQSAKRPAVPVVVATARAGDFPVYLTGLGSVVAFNTVTVKSRVDGQLINVAFREGQLVREGDLLAEVDPRPFQVQLEQAEGQLARDRAQGRGGAHDEPPGARRAGSRRGGGRREAGRGGTARPRLQHPPRAAPPRSRAGPRSGLERPETSTHHTGTPAGQQQRSRGG